MDTNRINRECVRIQSILAAPVDETTARALHIALCALQWAVSSHPEGMDLPGDVAKIQGHLINEANVKAQGAA